MRDGRPCVRRRRPRGVEPACGAAPRRWSSVGTGRTSSVAGERARAQHSPLQLTHFLCHSCRGRDEPDQRGCGGGGGGGSYGGGPRDDGPGKRRRGGGAELEPGELEPGEIDYEPRGPRGVSSAVPLGDLPTLCIAQPDLCHPDQGDALQTGPERSTRLHLDARKYRKQGLCYSNTALGPDLPGRRFLPASILPI